MISSAPCSTEPQRKARQRGWLFSLCLAFLCLLTPAAVLAEQAAAGSYLAELLAKAQEHQLHRERYWHILLHYQPTLTGGVESLIDDPRFFLGADGKHDPAAELAATLTALFTVPGAGEEDPHCRFVARDAWLRERLAIDPSRLPPAACSEFEQALAKVDPRSATLIFPGNHNNSPASMFGHTLINIDGPYQSRLLSYAVNYSAFTDESNGFAYAVKGIIGLYRGYYSILPYYVKVREYNDLERRDVWEYEMNLTAEEVTRMFRHIWELRDIYSDYYFFDENCSYNLLFLLEAARPTLDLTARCRPWVIPIDTVRLVRESDLVVEARYRPSKATRISHLAGRMNRGEERLAKELLAGKIEPGELATTETRPAGQIRILDLAAETVEFRYFRHEMDREEYRRRYLSLLQVRSRLGLAEPADTDIQVPGRPDRGHGSNRFGLAAGWREDDFFLETRIRPAYHHLMDADAGYLAGSQIDFANVALRYYPERHRLELHAFDLINIVSLSPRHPFFKPVSWKVETGFIRRSFEDGNEHLAYRLNPGGGFAWGGGAQLAYVLFETDAQLGGRFRDGFALGFGGSAGLLRNVTERWKVHLRGRQIHYLFGDPHRGEEVGLEQAFTINPAHGLVLDLAWRHEFGVETTEGKFGWNWYW
jgi:hypothetical protein